MARLHSPGRNCAPAARQRSRTGRVVGAAERPCRHEAPACGHLPGDGVNFRRLHSFFPGQGRQDAGQAAGQHGFAGAGRTDEQDVVSARSRDDHRPAGQRLAADVSEIGNMVPRIGRVEGNRHRGQDGLDAPQCIHDLTGRCGRVDLHLAAAGLSGFGSVLGRDIERPHPLAAASSAMGRTPDTGRRLPSSASSPERPCPSAAAPAARSGAPPAAGAGHTPGRSCGHRRERVDGDAAVRPLEAQIFRAAWTRSPLSRTAESGRPTMERAGIPPEMSASTSTGKPLRPLRPKLLRLRTWALLSARWGGETIHKRDGIFWCSKFIPR